MNFQLENLMSAVGLFSMLVIAWAFSYHRTKVKFRPIVVGMSLQFLLAMFIMPDNATISFTGMAVLITAVSVYILNPLFGGTNALKSYAPAGGVALGIGAVLYFLGSVIHLGWVMALAVLTIILNAYVLKKNNLSRIAGVVFLTAGGALCITKDLIGKVIFRTFSDGVESFLALAGYGSEFMFGFQWYKTTENEFFPGFAATFAFSVLPTIIFFAAFMSVLYYLGIVQKIVLAMSHFMRWAMGTSGSESLSCTANIFIGQTEAPLLVRPFLDGMTKSELLTIMVGGFATIAGSVLAGYIAFGVDAGHLIAASVMSAPAALVIGKIIYPELEHSQTAGDVELPKLDSGDNILDAASSGISDGLHLALNVGAMLIGFIALVACVDVVLNWADSIIDGQWLGGEYVAYSVSGFSPATGEFAGYFPGSLSTIFGVVLSPLAFLMGVPWEDTASVGNLLGMKLSLNEFVAYAQLGNLINESALTPRGQLIATYALCGFANFASIGIQLGGIGSLAPERRKDLSRLAFRAMLGGALASWTTACVAGIFFMG